MWWVGVPAMISGLGAWAALADAKTGWTVASAATAAVIGAFGPSLVDRFTKRQLRPTEERAKAARATLDQAVDRLAVSTSTPSLDEELGEVSATLTATMARLHDISERARAFEDDVRQLVKRGEAARATAQINEEAARKIAQILGEETGMRIKTEVDRLTEAYDAQIDALKKSATARPG